VPQFLYAGQEFQAKIHYRAALRPDGPDASAALSRAAKVRGGV
jgi:hypothetical protein